ncbi:MAG TPA: DegT/DnrJ/EryC1/StrS aminotransferase family protein [Bacilli bacterium]|mgnify:CR=1 FL=1|jgi:dTDP-4-amino-4,6-dideoxygalactose transaminase|nr:DegT/DnrJ/EryC1/StrS aminotransferase family protein [Bacilli bacterium]
MENNRTIPFSPPDITSLEIDEVIDTLKSGWITTGPKTKKFEQQLAQYVGVKRAVCLNSATAAMELSLLIFGVGPGDEVITSAYTYSASASIIHHVGASIVLVDIAPGSFEMDYNQLAEKITSKTKVIIPVDIAGVICEYEKIYKIVQTKQSLFKPTNDRQASLGRILVMADAAHSFGATRNNKTVGLHADITCFSFHAVKNLTTAEGGAVVWTHDLGLTDDGLYKEFMLMSLHGQSKDALSKSRIGAWEYDIITLGYKCNMTDIIASLGLIQLQRYPLLLERRFSLIDEYVRQLKHPSIKLIAHKGDNFVSSGHLMLMNIKNVDEHKRNHIIDELSKVGISTNVHYKPLPMHTAYKNLGFSIKDYPNSFDAYKNEITLPLHSLMSNDDVGYVCSALLRILKDLGFEQQKYENIL